MPQPILIRRASAADAPAYARINAAPQVFGGLMQLPYPDAESTRKWLAERSGGADQAELLLVAELDGDVVGTAALHPIPRLRRRHAMMLGISVALEHQRRGVGNALMAALCDYADNWAQVLRIELTVYTDNAAAIALYRKHGFEIEGTHRAYALRAGEFIDAYSMARLHPRPPALPRA